MPNLYLKRIISLTLVVAIIAAASASALPRNGASYASHDAPLAQLHLKPGVVKLTKSNRNRAREAELPTQRTNLNQANAPSLRSVIEQVKLPKVATLLEKARLSDLVVGPHNLTKLLHQAEHLTGANLTSLLERVDEKAARCPVDWHFAKLKPCECSLNHGSLSGTVDITCPASVGSTRELQDIVSRTHFFTQDVDTFTINGSPMKGVLNLEILEPLRISVLNMDSNQINFINTHSFNSSAETLSVVSLAQNSIKYFQFESIQEIPQLYSLNLAGNELLIIPAEAFAHPNLKYLDLSSNKISTISKRSFWGLQEIQSIDLSNNRLEYIPGFSFEIENRASSNILEINLRQNNISHISFNAFKSLRKMQIDLRDNTLISLEQRTYRSIIHTSFPYAFFYVNGNPLSCDCSLEWITNDLRARNSFDDFKCEDNSSSHFLHSLGPEDFDHCFRHTNNASLPELP